ncbi:MAG: MBL fold metallo-hydrolase [Leptospiraceae bacterium]|nr:MBL fold metallo-hydrolase [Leptospiraceae bacterium]
MKKYFKVMGLIVLLGIIIVGVKAFPFLKVMSEIEVVEYDKNLTLVLGGGGNSAILVGDKEVLVVDSKVASGKSKLFDLVKQKAGDKPIILVNTHLHGDHAKGNPLYKGNTIIAGAYQKEDWVKENGDDGLPTEWLKDTKEIVIGDETVILKNVGQAHTLNDVVVFFKNRKMLFLGDMLMIGMHPFLKENHGSKIALYIEKTNLVMAEFQPEKIIPGHGRVGGKELVDELQTYFADTKSVAEGKSELTAIEEKYKDWISFFHMSGTSATVKYWKKELGIK